MDAVCDADAAETSSMMGPEVHTNGVLRDSCHGKDTTHGDDFGFAGCAIEEFREEDLWERVRAERIHCRSNAEAALAKMGGCEYGPVSSFEYCGHEIVFYGNRKRP